MSFYLCMYNFEIAYICCWHTHTHTHTHIYIYIYIYISCFCCLVGPSLKVWNKCGYIFRVPCLAIPASVHYNCLGSTPPPTCKSTVLSDFICGPPRNPTLTIWFFNRTWIGRLLYVALIGVVTTCVSDSSSGRQESLLSCRLHFLMLVIRFWHVEDPTVRFLYVTCYKVAASLEL